MDMKEEMAKALQTFAAEQRKQMLIDVTGILSPLLTVICGEMPDPSRVADKLDEMAATAPPSSEASVQVAARLAALLANAVRANAGATPRPNA